MNNSKFYSKTPIQRKYQLRSIYYLPLLLIIFLYSVLPAQKITSFKIVVNKSNPVDTMTRDEISRLFLKKNPQWKNGVKTIPVDIVSSNPLREIFSQCIHLKAQSVIKIYWQKKIYAGTDIPPAEKTGDNEVLDFVSNHAGAIGYVSSRADLDAVKEIQITK